MNSRRATLEVADEDLMPAPVAQVVDDPDQQGAGRVDENAAARTDSAGRATDDDAPTWQEPGEKREPGRGRFGPIGLMLSFLLLLLTIQGGVDAWLWLRASWLANPWMGSLYGFLLMGFLLALAAQLRALLRDWRQGRALDRLRAAERACVDSGPLQSDVDLAVDELLQALRLHYPDRADLQLELERARDRLDGRRLTTDLDAQRQLELLSVGLFVEIDRQVADCIHQHALQAALLAALSRLPLLDALFVLWRGLRMIRVICGLYQVTPGLLGTLRLARQVMHYLLFANLSELAAEAASYALGHSLASTLSAQAAQGVGVGLMTGRLGYAVVRICRPLPPPPRLADELSIAGLYRSLYGRMKQAVAGSQEN